MARGSWESPPRWALIVVALCAIALVVGFTATRNRGDLSPKQIADAEAATSSRRAAEAAASSSAADAAKVHVSLPSGRPLQVLFSGDSVTHGFYATSRSKTWPALVAGKLGGSVTVANTAIPGYTVTDGLKEPIPAGIDLAFVMYGNNDIDKSTLAAYRRDYALLLAHIRAKDPQAQIVCVSPWESAAYTAHGSSAAQFAAAARQACTAAGGHFVDVMSLFTSTLNAQVGAPYAEGTAPDNAHPSDAGHALIASTVLAQIIVTAAAR